MISAGRDQVSSATFSYREGWNDHCDFCDSVVGADDECWLWMGTESCSPIMHSLCFVDWMQRLLPDLQKVLATRRPRTRRASDA